MKTEIRKKLRALCLCAILVFVTILGMLMNTAKQTEASVYGQDPISYLYGSGFFRTTKISAYGSGMSLEYPFEGNAASYDTAVPSLVFRNSSKADNVYVDMEKVGYLRDMENGEALTRVDLRIYPSVTYGYSSEHTDGVGGYFRGNVFGVNYSRQDNTAISKREQVYITLEFHFYKAGTLESSSPEEISARGMFFINNLDQRVMNKQTYSEGVALVSGGTGAYYWADDSTRKLTRSVKDDGLTWYYNNTEEADDTREGAYSVGFFFRSYKNVPLTIKYDAGIGFSSNISRSSTGISYQLQNGRTSFYPVPSGYTSEEFAALTPDTRYMGINTNIGIQSPTDYAKELWESPEEVEGYTFSGWYTDAALTIEYARAANQYVTGPMTFYGQYIPDDREVQVRYLAAEDQTPLTEDVTLSGRTDEEYTTEIKEFTSDDNW